MLAVTEENRGRAAGDDRWHEGGQARPMLYGKGGRRKVAEAEAKRALHAVAEARHGTAIAS